MMDTDYSNIEDSLEDLYQALEDAKTHIRIWTTEFERLDTEIKSHSTNEKLPIAAIIQLISQYSIDEYNDYVEQCKVDYSEYVPHSDYEERHRRGVILSAARRLVDIRWSMPGVFEPNDQPDSTED